MIGTARWIDRPRTDIPTALLWIPFAIVAHFLEGDTVRLNAYVGAVFLLSFSHQPLTMALIYGDPAQFAVRRKLFSIAPFVLVAAIVAGQSISLVLVGLVAGLWNAEHTLMQRYGLTRIYGRKAGDDQGGIERMMLVSWLVLAVVWVAADSRTPGFAAKIDLGTINNNSIDALQWIRPGAIAGLLILVPFVIAISTRWVRSEIASGPAANSAKHLYVGSTALLFVVILIDPIAGFAGFVGSHALEYYSIVHQTLGRRYRSGGGLLGRVVRFPTGRIGFFGCYLGALFAMVWGLNRYSTPAVATSFILTLGAMHLLFDGFIWKLRRPEVSMSFAIESNAG